MSTNESNISNQDLYAQFQSDPSDGVNRVTRVVTGVEPQRTVTLANDTGSTTTVHADGSVVKEQKHHAVKVGRSDARFVDKAGRPVMGDEINGDTIVNANLNGRPFQ